MSKGGLMIVAGGTGGHVFPALAVAKELQGKGVVVRWMGINVALSRGLCQRRIFQSTGLLSKDCAAKDGSVFSLRRLNSFELCGRRVD